MPLDGLFVFFCFFLIFTTDNEIPVYLGSCFYIYYFNLVLFVLFVFVTVGSFF